MRPIKFRAWYSDWGEFIPIARIEFKENGEMLGIISYETREITEDVVEHHEITRESNWWDIDEVKLIQFIEQTDKNDVELFEGDIVKCIMHRTEQRGIAMIRIPDKEWIAVVEHDRLNPCFALKDVKTGYLEYDFNKCDLLKLEKIGNIHENPELLES